MEFKYRSVDYRAPPAEPPPPFFRHSSTMPYFPEQASRGGYPLDDPRVSPDMMHPEMMHRISPEMMRRMSPELMRGPGDTYDAMQREIEKEQIRQEILAEERARRRILEAEVRREMMMEREMAMRAAMVEKVPFEDRFTMPYDRRGDGRFLDDGFGIGCSGGGFERMLPPEASFPRAHEPMGLSGVVKPPMESNKDKLIILPKPKPKTSGEKRKAEEPPAHPADLTSLLLKKPKEEWSCPVCQITATSEKGLEQHLLGKKHKAKEAKLRAQKYGKKSNKGKKAAKPTKETLAPAGKEGLNVNGEPAEPEKSENELLKEVEVSSKLNDDKQLTLDDQHAEEPKKTDAVAQKEKPNKTAGPPELRKREYKHWCEICRVGTYSAKVMGNHRRGKKHRSRVEGPKQSEVAVPAAAATNLVDEKKPLLEQQRGEEVIPIGAKTPNSVEAIDEEAAAAGEFVGATGEEDAGIVAGEDEKAEETAAVE